MRRGQLIWQAYGLDALIDGEPQSLPSDRLDSFMAQLAGADLGSVLAALMPEGD
jgi:hypothetical protein